MAKMATDGWAYYAEQIANGREDYFAREEPGRWLGRGAEAIGLSGEVEAIGLERLFSEARHPTTDRALGRPFGTGKSAVAGYALSFSPPKSVSVLWALGDDQVVGVVQAGHDAAVQAALSYLERHAAFTRRGKGGIFQTDTHGLIGAAFVHRTSRALDPQLHTHVLVANKVQDANDGAWLALDGSELYGNQKAAGMLYKAALRAELTARLGVAWTSVDANGIAEIKGVPKELIEHWSTRRKEVAAAAKVLIAEREAALGRRLTNAERTEAHQLAAYRTRGAKAEETHSTSELRAGWRAEAEALGHDPERWMKGALQPTRTGRLGLGPQALLEQAQELLQESSSTWRRAEAVEVMSVLLDNRDLQSPSATRLVKAVEFATEALLGSRGILNLAVPSMVEEPAEHLRRDGLPTHIHHGATRYSTEETLLRETEVLGLAAGGREAGRAVLDVIDLEHRIAVAGLGEDQAAALRRMCLSGEAICCITGPAGAGKTRMLAVATGAFEAAGHRVLGLAPSAMAAGVLKDEATMAIDTVARFLLRAEAGLVDLCPHDVVVLDEAAMARSADLARLVRIVDRRGAKLVAIGDPAQLGAVGAGGLFATLAMDTRAEALGLPRRFLHAWEKETVLRLRARNQQVIEAYALHNRITDAVPDDAVDLAFEHWQAARAEGRSVLLLASDCQMVNALNATVRAARVAAREVEEFGLMCRRQFVGIGDEVVTLRNERSLTTSCGEWVRNGERWSVLDRTGSSLLLTHAEGRGEIWLPVAYATEHVGLGYALTIHKAQGATVDRAVVVVDQKMTAEQLYVGMSRGREHNQAVVVREAPDTGHGYFHTPSAAEVLSRVLRHSGAEASATATIRRVFEEAQEPKLLEALVEQAERTLERLAGKDRTCEIAALTAHADVDAVRQKLLEASDRSRAAATELAELERQAMSWKKRLPGVEKISESQLQEARCRASVARRAYEQARHQLYETEQARAELDLLEERQAQRGGWLEAHPQYVEAIEWRRRELQQARKARAERVRLESLARAAPNRAEPPERCMEEQPVPIIEGDDLTVDLEPNRDHGRRVATRSSTHSVTQSVPRRDARRASYVKRGRGRSR